MAFSPDGTRLASASLDRTVRIWDTVPYRVRYWERRAAKAMREGRFDEAERLYRKALRGSRDALGDDHPGTLHPFRGLVESLIGQKEHSKFADAEPMAKEHYDNAMTAYGERNINTTRAAQLLVDLFEAWDAAEPGRSYGARAAEWRSRLPDLRDPRKQQP